MTAWFTTLLAKWTVTTTNPPIRGARVGLVALAVLVVVGVAFAIAAPGHMAVLASGQAWGK